MTVLLAELIEFYKNKIATFTGVSVTLGMPDDSEPGLYFLPYNCFQYFPKRNTSPIRNLPGGEREPQSYSYTVKCLLIPSPSIDYVILDKGLNCISTNSFLEFNNGRIKVAFESISTEELTSLFISTGTTYRLSIPFQMWYDPN